MDSSLKVSRQVTQAAFKKPFWGSMMLSLDVTENNNINTMATDGKHIFWNDAFTQKLSEEECLGVLCHEVCHVMYDHCQDFAPKDPRKVNIAQDYVINAMLILDESLKLPKDICFDQKYHNWTWQQVYADKEANDDWPDLPEDGFGPGDIINDPNMGEAEKGELREEIKRKVIQAAEAQKNSGVGDLPAGIEGLIKEIRESKVDWKAMIRANVKSNFPDDYTMNKPNKKFLQTYGIYMPTMYSETVNAIGIGVDTSGSMCDADYIKILSELNALCQEIKPLKIYVFYTDCEVAKVEVFEVGDDITQLETEGGGGTSFVPVFDYIEKTGLEIDQLIYMSDMEVYDGCFPEFAPTYPVLWLSTRDEYPVPFGDLVRVKD